MSLAKSAPVTAPQAGEYAPYYDRYISLVSTSNILDTLKQQARQTHELFARCSEQNANYSYAPGKWSVKEALGHMIDTERIFAYRALRIARNDQTPMAGFEQDDYVKYGPFRDCTLAELLEEFSAVRTATLCLLRGFPDEAWTRKGMASGNPVTVRALAYMIAGHELHHQNVLQEKYAAAFG
jgi:uncharacterized damage-inducible protein DinB